MINLKNYLFEGLKIGSNTKITHYTLDDYADIKCDNVGRMINLSYHTFNEQNSHYGKMAAYKDKGSKPQRLANSIKDKNKLVMRWYVAITIDWIDCALVFRDEIINRGYANDDELTAYIVKQYTNIYKNHKSGHPFEKYLNAVGVNC